MQPQVEDVTGLLSRWRSGDRRALDQLMPIVYGELRRLADRAMRRERQDHTLQVTALVHEAYLRLDRARLPVWRDRMHFFAIAATMMRRILVDHARGLLAARRGAGAARVCLDDQALSPQAPLLDLLVLDEALSALADLDRRKAKVIELRFFAGLSVDECAELLGVSPPTVVLDTRLARAWLYDRVQGA